MIKYFCDLCGTETAEVDLYEVLIHDFEKDKKKDRIPLKYRRDLCKDCYLKLHEFIELGSQKGVN